MEIKVSLKDHKIYKWEKNGETFLRRGFYKDFSIDTFTEEEELINQVKEINGIYAAVIKRNEYYYLVGDRFQSFPILYYVNGNSMVISDSLELIEQDNKLVLNRNNLHEFIAMGVVSGCETLYKNLFVVEAGQIVKINACSGKIEKIDYYTHMHCNDYIDKSFNDLKRELDNRLEAVFKHIKSQLGKRTVVLTLSGGYDSRLVAEMLKKTGINDVICVSYGNKHDKEVKVAERLAKELGFRWIYVKQSPSIVEKMVKDNKFWPVMKEISAASAIPYIQNYIIKMLIDNGTIPMNSVIMTGNSGDVVEGDQMPEAFNSIEGKYTREELLGEILNKHYRLAGLRGGAIPHVKNKILESYLTNECYNYDDVHDLYEKYNWRERQSQFLFNDGSYYAEYCGLEWYFPLWDNEFVEFWLHLPTELRFKRNFYYKYVNKEHIYSANDKTVRDYVLQAAKDWFYPILKKMYKYKRIAEYSDGDSLWHLLDKETFLRMIKWTGGVGTSSDSAKIWGLLINCFQVDPWNEDFSVYKKNQD